MRKSVQKETILKIIDESTSHLTSKGVYESAKKTIPNIPPKISHIFFAFPSPVIF